MATVREHLKKAHEAIAEHHRSMSKAHNAAMAKESMGTHQHDFHKTAAAHHDAAAAAHETMLDECQKAADADLTKLVPTSVSAVVPNRVVAVPRPGQQPVAKANVPTEFSHLFQVEDEEARIG
jgi:hypothetical protein